MENNNKKWYRSKSFWIRVAIGNGEKGSFVIQLRDWKVVAGLLEARGSNGSLLSWFLFNQLTWKVLSNDYFIHYIIFIIIVMKLAFKVKLNGRGRSFVLWDRILFRFNKISIFFERSNKNRKYKKKSNFLNIPSMCPPNKFTINLANWQFKIFKVKCQILWKNSLE